VGDYTTNSDPLGAHEPPLRRDHGGTRRVATRLGRPRRRGEAARGGLIRVHRGTDVRAPPTPPKRESSLSLRVWVPPFAGANGENHSLSAAHSRASGEPRLRPPRRAAGPPRRSRLRLTG